MSSGESDDDYAPEENPVPLSEESTDDDTDASFLVGKTEVSKKRKRKGEKEQRKDPKKQSRNLKSRNCIPNEESEPETNEEDLETDIVEKKKKEEDLWAMFLDGTDPKPKPKESSKEPVAEVSVAAKVNDKATKSANKDDAKDREKRIFEFAGETIVVENNVIKERIKADEAGTSKIEKPPVRASTRGLTSLLGQIDKKNKLSTLEKSKLDWSTFKKDEGIEEEISSHNKGKQGYLERRDFLERADYRQYEIERDLRMTRRSNR